MFRRSFFENAAPSTARARVRSFVTTTTACLVIVAMAARLPLAMASSRPAAAQGNVELRAAKWSLSGVRHVIGLIDIKPKAVGTLWLSDVGIGFESENLTALVPAAQVLKISIGDERLLKGGAFGRFMRSGISGGGSLALGLAGIGHAFSIIPPAFGLVSSIVSQGSEDIITVEFVDPQDGYHGAVFTMARHGAETFPTKVVPSNSLAKNDGRGSCSAGANANSLTLLPVEMEAADVPAEYRVLVYERLFESLRAAQTEWPIYRAGSPSHHPDCAGWTVKVTAEDFRKGNAVERALSGPAGLFVGITKLNYRVVVSDSKGLAILDEQRRASSRGDSESLDLSKSIAKAISQKIRKLQAQS